MSAHLDTTGTLRHLSLVVSGSGDGSWEWDLSTDRLHFCPRWARLLGYEAAELAPHPDTWLSRVHPLDQQRLYETLADHIDGRTDRFRCEHRLRTRDGDYTWVLARGVAARDDGGTATRLGGLLSDLSRPRLHDRRTGLPNRFLFTQQLERALQNEDQLSVVALGLDGYARYEELLGHGRSTELLVMVAERISTCLNEERGHRIIPSTVSTAAAHIDGGCFAVLCTHIDSPRHAVALARRLREAASGVATLEERSLQLTLSAGLSLRGERSTAESLLRDARAALQRARAQGCGHLSVFDEGMRRAAERKAALEDALIGALERREFALYYQPIMDLQAGRVEGAETLLRWDSPRLGRVSPAEFIPLAEETGLIVPLGAHVLHRACAQGAEWLRRGLEVTISVNISVHQLDQAGFPELVARTLEETGLPPERLDLELTESALLGDERYASELLQRIADLGVTLSLDDFGTGYSSLSYLRRLPFQRLKIDRSFVSHMTENPQQASLTRTIVAMASNLGLAVIAEGIETREHASILKWLGCEYGQGYLFGRPMSAGDFGRWAGLGERSAG